MRSLPLIPGHWLSFCLRYSKSWKPFWLKFTRALGAPNSLIFFVKALVSIPYMPVILFLSSQTSKVSSFLQFDGSVGLARVITPAAVGFSDSLSSLFVPTMPICGNVKVIICSAYDGSEIIS